MDRCFNTSYVVIKLMDVSVYFVPDRRFNTSYVVIKQKANEDKLRKIEKFQYILCCY